ncbi:unnamed protein product [Cylindrotheca closterium]|uniref:Uncharacterized protein n=1 Tax=Cylindrotheca closterium TaxID=2856 RepID=A0AAD2FUZ7_9STRA|nr:unnamed protein product [Cylindrotheca closterium]
MKSSTLKKWLLVFMGATCFLYFSIIRLFLPIINNVSEESNLADIQRPDKLPLQHYIQGWNITRNVNWLLHFAIVGFPKTDERCELAWNQHVKLLKEMYKEYKPSLKMGIKCPTNLEVDVALQNYHMFFPATKFVVGLRHPVHWFESFYNFRITNGYDMPPAERLIGKCKRGFQNVCTFRANFSHHLEKIYDVQQQQETAASRQTFLYHVEQLRDYDVARSSVFLKDLGGFLGLSEALEQQMIWVKPGQRPASVEERKTLSSRRIDICEGKYSELRSVLMDQASLSASWIAEKFVKNPNVRVSSIAYFSQLLDKWHIDPCEDRQK